MSNEEKTGRDRQQFTQDLYPHMHGVAVTGWGPRPGAPAREQEWERERVDLSARSTWCGVTANGTIPITVDLQWTTAEARLVAAADQADADQADAAGKAEREAEQRDKMPAKMVANGGS